MSADRLPPASGARAARADRAPHPPLRYAVVAGGGTAGHRQPAVAIAEALVDAGHPREAIELVGSARSGDASALAGLGFPLTLLPGRGIERSLRPRALAADLRAGAGLAVAAVRACRLVVRARPRVVVSVGVYASAAAAAAAALLRVPLVLVNVDAVPGAANRLFGRLSAAAAVGWPGTALPRAKVTGTPVRPAIAAVRRSSPEARTAARRALGLPVDRPTVAVVGGSLGARRLNEAVDGLVFTWRDRLDRALYHVVGPRDWPGGAGREDGARALAVRRVRYEERMELVYTAADVMVCRAGAMTVAELAVSGCPAVLVPLPGAPGDHQTANARLLERAGSARLLPDPECTGATLAVVLDDLLADGRRLTAMGRAARDLGRADAAAAIARLVEDHARPAPGPSDRADAGHPDPPPPATRAAPGSPSTAATTATAAPEVRDVGGRDGRVDGGARHREGRWSADPTVPQRVHVVGIGGAGMSAIATVLAAMGHTVTGSDLRASVVTDRLAARGVGVAIGHAPGNVGEAGVVTASAAVAPDNPELAEARRLGRRVVSRAEALSGVAACRRTLAVGGTHGKTTTASMLALTLVEAGLRPSFLVGGDVTQVGTNAVWDEGEWLVVEADESDGSFLELDPEIAVITNVEPDHLDHYGGFERLRAAFERFGAGSAHVVVGGDDAVAAAVGREHGGDVVGFAPSCTHRIMRLECSRRSVSFELAPPDGAAPLRLAVPVPGAHNAQNAAVATVAALAAGAPPAAAVSALARFGGVARRFEFRGSAGTVTLVDDYGHLPGEVRATLAAAREGGWRRVVAVFQPHRYSRTAAMAGDFGPAFGDADVVVVTDVYGAGEAPVPGVTGELVAEAVRRAAPERPVHYVPGRAGLAGAVAGLLEPGDLCLSMGAGDVTTLPDELLSRLGT